MCELVTLLQCCGYDPLKQYRALYRVVRCKTKPYMHYSGVLMCIVARSYRACKGVKQYYRGVLMYIVARSYRVCQDVKQYCRGVLMCIVAGSYVCV